MKCLDTILSRVLVDTWILLKPSALIVKAFDSLNRAMIGKVDLAIHIGPHTFSITFQVMDIHPTYNCLLGHPWIHVAGAITSTIHQKLKFITSGKMIVVGGEKDILVSHISSFRYISVAEEMLETPFLALEVASTVEIHPVEEPKKLETSMASWKGEKAIVEAGQTEG